MQVVCKSPGRPPVITQVKNTLEALQQAVGGPIETVTLARDAVIICNEEGWLRDLPFNCRFCGINFVGTILVVGVDGDEFSGLSEADAKTVVRWLGGA